MIAFAAKNHSALNIQFKEGDITQHDELLAGCADLIICSWAISHIPAALQAAALANMRSYLSEEGKLFITFPILGSTLSSAIEETRRAPRWQEMLSGDSARVSYSPEKFKLLLEQQGFEAVDAKSKKMIVTFENESELRIFVHTSIARLLDKLGEQYNDFILDVVDNYKKKCGNDNLNYEVTMLYASGLKPSLNAQKKLHMSYSGDIPIPEKGEMSCELEFSPIRYSPFRG